MCLLHGPCHLLGCGLPSRLRGSVLSVSSLCGRWSQERLLREWASGTGEGRKLLVSVHKRATSVGSRGPVALGTSGDRVEHAPELPPCWAGALGDFRDCQSVRCSRQGTGSVRGTGIPCHLHLAQTSLPCRKPSPCPPSSSWPSFLQCPAAPRQTPILVLQGLMA